MKKILFIIGVFLLGGCGAHLYHKHDHHKSKKRKYLNQNIKKPPFKILPIEKNTEPSIPAIPPSSSIPEEQTEEPPKYWWFWN